MVDNVSINEARFWRIKHENKSSQYSYCYFSDIRAYGTYYLANDIADLTNTSCDITFYNISSKKFDKIMENIVFYQNQVSAYVDAFSPSFVIRKDKLDFSFNLSKNIPDVKMKIDNLECTNLTLQTGTNYTCTVNDPNYTISSVPKVEIFSPSSGRISLGANQIKLFDKSKKKHLIKFKYVSTSICNSKNPEVKLDIAKKLEKDMSFKKINKIIICI